MQRSMPNRLARSDKRGRHVVYMHRGKARSLKDKMAPELEGEEQIGTDYRRKTPYTMSHVDHKGRHVMNMKKGKPKRVRTKMPVLIEY